MASATAARRRSPSAHSRPAIQWHKVGRLALLFMLFVILLLYIRPVAHWIQQRSTAAHSTADLRDLQAEHDRLKTRLEQLSATGGIEREARKMGMVRRGERPYVIQQP